MTLYRQAETFQADEGTGSFEDGAVRLWVVPVEPCVHGNYDRHEYSFNRTDCGGGKGHDDDEGGVFFCESFDWCDGAGLKETDE